MRYGLVILASLVLAACAPRPAPPLPAGEAVALPTPQGRIVGRVYPSRGPARVLVVVLHGDSPRAPVRYHYDLAAAIAKAVPGVTAVGLMRPGYADPGAGASDGSYGNTWGATIRPK